MESLCDDIVSDVPLVIKIGLITLIIIYSLGFIKSE
jgi:hypothetical protein